MHILLPFHRNDFDQALWWMQWMVELGAGKNHPLILMPAKNVLDHTPIMELAVRAFAEVSILPDAEAISGHPEGPNSMMRQAVWHMQITHPNAHWAFREPDAIYLTHDAIDIEEREYRAYGKPFMCGLRPSHDVTPDHPTGNMILPKGALLEAPMLARKGLSVDGVELAFDIVAAAQILPKAHITKLIQQEPKPTVETGISFPDQASLKLIRSDAVLFHPCKDGSLIARLRESILKNQVPARQNYAQPNSSIHFDDPKDETPNNEKEQLLTKALARIQELEEENSRLKSEVVANRITPHKEIGKEVPPPGSKKWKRKPMSPERKAKLSANLAKAREVKKLKQFAA